MTSLNDSSPHQKDAAVSSSRRQLSTDFRMIPNEADCQGNTTIVLLFDDDVATATAIMATNKNHQQQQLPVSKVHSRAFSFIAPEQYDEDVVDIWVSINSHVVGRRPLTYSFSSLRLARHLSTFYCRLLDVACQHQQQHQSGSDGVVVELDAALAGTVDTDCAITSLACDRLFGVYRHCTHAAGDDDMTAMTALHVAACHGLASFAERLSTLPAAATAASVMDFDRQTPGNLARCRGNVATADVIDRLINQQVAEAEYMKTEEQQISSVSEVTTVRGEGAVASGPAPDGSSYFVLAYLSDDDDSNTSAAVNSQPAAVQQPAHRERDTYASNGTTTNTPSAGDDSAGDDAEAESPSICTLPSPPPLPCVDHRRLLPRHQHQHRDEEAEMRTYVTPTPCPRPPVPVARRTCTTTTTPSPAADDEPESPSIRTLPSPPPLPPARPCKRAGAVRGPLPNPPSRSGSEPTASRPGPLGRDRKAQSSPDVPPPRGPRRPQNTVASTSHTRSPAGLAGRMALPEALSVSAEDVNLLNQYVPMGPTGNARRVNTSPSRSGP